MAACLCAPLICAAEPEATASFSLIGPITRDASDSFRKVVATASPQVRWLVVDSPGGDVEAALDMANLMHAKGISIYVRGHCASSCANYLFIAARSKVLGPNAIVGWHGSPASEHIAGIDALPARERVAADAIRRRLVREEPRLLARVRVDPRLLCAGDRTIAKAGALGWTMPIRAMSKFGVGSVVSLGEGRNIPSRVPGHDEPFLTLDPNLDCKLTYPNIGPVAY